MATPGDVQRTLASIEQTITRLDDSRLPSRIGYNPTEFERIGEQLYQLKTARTNLRTALASGSPAVMRTRIAEANAILTSINTPGAAAAAPPSGGPGASSAASAPPPPGGGTTIPGGIVPGVGAPTSSAPIGWAASMLGHAGAPAASTAPPRGISGAPGGAPPPGGGTTSAVAEEDDCPICLTDMNTGGQPIHTGPCGHRMHRTCYNAMPPAYNVGPKAGQKACPICRWNGVGVTPVRSVGYGKYRSTRYVM
jgi:hypothetical protein